MKWIAHIVSYIFHPLLMLTYGLLFMIWINPYQFGSPDEQMLTYMIASIFGISFLFPVFSVFLMRMLGMVDSFQMEDREERIIPYVSTAIFYLWLALTVYRTSIFPRSFEIFTIGATIALLLAFFMNLFSKISMHATGMGGLVGMVLINMLYYSYDNLKIMLLVTILLSGLVGTSRLLLKAHEPRDIYGGYFVGFCAQFLALSLLF